MKKVLTSFVMCVMILSTAAYADPIVTESTSDSTVNTTSDTTTTVNSPPPSAISPSINGSNSDLCTTGSAQAVQTQILGLSTGGTVTDENCERLKLSKTMYDMGMKVAAVSVMCQDARVFDAMKMAGTPCPFEGKIGEEAATLWADNPDLAPQHQIRKDNGNGREVFTLLAIITVIAALATGL